MLGGFYALATAPLLAVVVLDQIRVLHRSRRRPSADYIYTILRNPHHLAPFSVPGKLHRWVPGAVATPALAAGAVSVALRGAGRCARWRRWCRLLRSLLLGAGGELADRATGVLAELDLFRPSSLTLLLACLAAAIPPAEVRRGTANVARAAGGAAAVVLFVSA